VEGSGGCRDSENDEAMGSEADDVIGDNVIDDMVAAARSAVVTICV